MDRVLNEDTCRAHNWKNQQIINCRTSFCADYFVSVFTPSAEDKLFLKTFPLSYQFLLCLWGEILINSYWMEHYGFEPQATTRSSTPASCYALTRTRCCSLGDTVSALEFILRLLPLMIYTVAACGFGNWLYLSMLSACTCCLAYLTVRLNTSDITWLHMYEWIEKKP